MKNNKGFATSFILFSLLALFLVVVSVLLLTMNNSSNLNSTLKNKLLKKLEKNKLAAIEEDGIYEFSYTGKEEVFTAPEAGYYKVELWGAQGGSCTDGYIGGYGGYSVATIYLDKNDELYVNVGENGKYYESNTANNGTYNGGGGATFADNNWKGGTGGGSTEILVGAESNVTLDNYTYKNTTQYYENRIIVAAGGGGAICGYEKHNGGHAGGISSSNISGFANNSTVYGATQSRAGYNSDSSASSLTKGGLGYGGRGYYGSGGGAGYYGGGGGYGSPATGGSGYIANESLTNKAMYCYGCQESTEEATKTISTTGTSSERDTTNCADGYSNNPVAKCAKSGSGYAKITYIASGEYVFDYKNEYQEFTAPITGYYKVELWGAQGVTYGFAASGGKGAYTEGIIQLNKDEKIYIYTGEEGGTTTGGFNGGGSGRLGNTTGARYGGGATDVRYFSSTPSAQDLQWDSAVGLASRIMVAAGGGGGNNENNANRYTQGSAGGLTGYAFVDANYTTYTARGGTQTSGGVVTNYSSSYEAATDGSFGKGGIGGGQSSATDGSAGGGGGYYGGAGGSRLQTGSWGGGGGSSYISGHKGSIAILSQDSITPRNNKKGIQCGTGTIDSYCSKHYSGKFFVDTKIVDGLGYEWTTERQSSITGMPTTDGTSTENGHTGNGYAKITIVDEPEIEEETELVEEYEYDSEHGYQTFTAPYTGVYKVELWGAQGGSETNTNKAGYTSGKIQLKKDEILYIYVGQQGSKTSETIFNGGGNGGYSASDATVRGNSGGGATDVRYFKTTPSAEDLVWNSPNGLAARIMVAAGSGGGTISVYENAGGNSIAGGLTGSAGGYYSGHGNQGQNGQGGSQLSGGAAGVNLYNGTGTATSGSFGLGGSSEGTSTANGAGGGGGGYYGGGAGGSIQSGGAGIGGGGGSSYISGHLGCIAITSASDLTQRLDSSNSTCSIESALTDSKCSEHFTEKVFTDTVMKSGSESMPATDGISTETGHLGSGFAKITLIQKVTAEHIATIPTLTSDTSYGTITYDSIYASYHDGYYAFNGVKSGSDKWLNRNTASGWLQWQFPKQYKITSFNIYGSDMSSRTPKTVELLGSNDGSNYDSLVTQSLSAMGSTTSATVAVPTNKQGYYSYYKWNFPDGNYGDGTGTAVGEIEITAYEQE